MFSNGAQSDGFETAKQTCTNTRRGWGGGERPLAGPWRGSGVALALLSGWLGVGAEQTCTQGAERPLLGVVLALLAVG